MERAVIKVSIPHCYVWLVKTVRRDMRKDLYTRYVTDYLKRNEPNLRLVEIDFKALTALCERK
ncbi:hypothetical protein EQI27_06435 [Bacillus subtilis]|uniref:hypothetical protein n=1 Tax=Bacillus sp. DM2 TaxID=2267265 RepID=UPI000DEEAEBF|nr:hypothetical protein [Bacillus subtilis]AXF32490.1 hypothetical protein DS740_06425 [Bacillus sp. DM2]QAS11503.1 hypothetical protein EQI27_06435 [Bacillus subtilis]